VAIVAVSISPIGEGVGVSAYVTAAIEVLHGQQQVRYELGPMFTSLEGDLDEIMALVRRMQEAVFAAGAKRVSTVLKIDDRRDRTVSMSDKVGAVEAQLSERE
jgi:uncharacterized protein (TIGR00106 family)